MKIIFEGAKIVFGDRRLWPFLWRPWVLSGVLFLAVLLGGYVFWLPYAGALAGRLGLPDWVGASLGTVLYAVVWWFASGVVFLFLAGILSSLLWDELSRQVELRLTGTFADRAPGCAGQAWDTLVRLPFSAAIALGTLLLGWTCLGITGVLLAGWLGVYDYSACAYVRRSILFPSQFFRVLRSPSWAGFALGSGFITLLPFVNVFLFPALVAGGTMLCLEGEENRKAKPSSGSDSYL